MMELWDGMSSMFGDIGEGIVSGGEEVGSWFGIGDGAGEVISSADAVANNAQAITGAAPQGMYKINGGLSAQEIADIDSPTGQGAAKAVSQYDPALSNSGKIKDKSWMNEGLRAALKGMGRVPAVGGGMAPSGFAPSGNVSVSGGNDPLKMMKYLTEGKPALNDIGQWQRLFG